MSSSGDIESKTNLKTYIPYLPSQKKKQKWALFLKGQSSARGHILSEQIWAGKLI